MTADKTTDLPNEEIFAEIEQLLDQVGRSENPLPGEMRWTNDWLMSDLQMLPLEARGLFSELLTQAWPEGARLKRIDEDQLARLVRANSEEWTRAWPKISHYWKQAKDPRTGLMVLVNRSQLRFYLQSLRGRVPTILRNRRAAAESVRVRRARASQPPAPTARPRREPSKAVPPCPECGGELNRKQRSSSQGGQRYPPAWFCQSQRISILLNDPRVYEKLTEAARQSIDAELAAYEATVSTATEAEQPRTPRPPRPPAPGIAGGLAALENAGKM